MLHDQYHCCCLSPTQKIFQDIFFLTITLIARHTDTNGGWKLPGRITVCQDGRIHRNIHVARVGVLPPLLQIIRRRLQLIEGAAHLLGVHHIGAPVAETLDVGRGLRGRLLDVGPQGEPVPRAVHPRGAGVEGRHEILQDFFRGRAVPVLLGVRFAHEGGRLRAVVAGRRRRPPEGHGRRGAGRRGRRRFFVGGLVRGRSLASRWEEGGGHVFFHGGEVVQQGIEREMGVVDVGL
mmetsp:Transcript_8421/g.17332  ORF Transcript_8421/g.17332 Transcript_8421/m.17332 type:complete len:235 (+) Transcript_8421:109-813(+)